MNVSVLVPFRDEPGTTRKASWQWLRKRWKATFGNFQIVIGKDTGTPFSKTTAVNDAYTRAKGDVLVIADADSWVEPANLLLGIEYALRHDVLVIPWSESWRLTPEDSEAIMAQSPDVQNPLTKQIKDRCTDFRPAPETGAMMLVLKRECFERVGGMDPRFRGWGSEDVAFAIACQTMLGMNKVMLGPAWSLWHSRSRNEKGVRVWDKDDGYRNRALVRRYQQAYRSVEMMAALCAEHELPGHPISVPRSVVPQSEHLVREFAYSVMRDGERIAL